MKRRPAWRHLVEGGALFAVLGIALSLLSGWGVALYVNLPTRPPSQRWRSISCLGEAGNGRQWISRMNEHSLGVWHGEHSFSGWYPGAYPGDSDPTAAFGSARDLPRWSQGAQTPDPQSPPYLRVFDTACGWPVVAWTGKFLTTNDHPIPIAARDGAARWCIAADVSYDFGKLLVLLPYRPLFPGALWSTFIYGGASFLLWNLLGLAYTLLLIAPRRARRRAAGRCAHCGYLLMGLPSCPECGRGPHPAHLHPPRRPGARRAADPCNGFIP